MWRVLALVEPRAGDPGAPGKVAMLDFAGNPPGVSHIGPAGERIRRGGRDHRAGQEGPPSVQAVGAPP